MFVKVKKGGAFVNYFLMIVQNVEILGAPGNGC